MSTAERRRAGTGLELGYWLLVACWAIATIGFVGLIVVSRILSGPLACDLGSQHSFYGEAHWSWAELGTVCQWDLGSAGTFESGPGLERWAIVFALVSPGVALVLGGKLLAPFRRRAAEVASAESGWPEQMPQPT